MDHFIPILICVARISDKIIVNVRLGRRGVNVNIYYSRIVQHLRNIWLSANHVPDLDLGCQDSYHMHLPPHPHHDPAGHDFSLAGSYPGSFSTLTINKSRQQKREWLRRQIFCSNQTFKTLDLTISSFSYHLHPCRHRMHLRVHQNLCLSGLGYPLLYSCHMHHHGCPYHCSVDLYLASASSYPKIHAYVQGKKFTSS